MTLFIAHMATLSSCMTFSLLHKNADKHAKQIYQRALTEILNKLKTRKQELSFKYGGKVIKYTRELDVRYRSYPYTPGGSLVFESIFLNINTIPSTRVQNYFRDL